MEEVEKDVERFDQADGIRAVGSGLPPLEG
jgi:hypothetical protein